MTTVKKTIAQQMLSYMREESDALSKDDIINNIWNTLDTNKQGDSNGKLDSEDNLNNFYSELFLSGGAVVDKKTLEDNFDYYCSEVKRLSKELGGLPKDDKPVEKSDVGEIPTARENLLDNPTGVGADAQTYIRHGIMEDYQLEDFNNILKSIADKDVPDSNILEFFNGFDLENSGWTSSGFFEQIMHRNKGYTQKFTFKQVVPVMKRLLNAIPQKYRGSKEFKQMYTIYKNSFKNKINSNELFKDERKWYSGAMPYLSGILPFFDSELYGRNDLDQFDDALEDLLEKMRKDGEVSSSSTDNVSTEEVQGEIE